MKTSVDNFVSRMKRMFDYDITDDDLTTLLIDCINDALKSIYQWLYDAGLYIDIGISTTLTMTADQAYIDISSTLANADDILRISERTNDKIVTRKSYYDFIALYPDPNANKSSMPKHFSIFYNRMYLGPTPNATGTLYVEYLTIPTDVSTGDTLPYKTKYDPLLRALTRQTFLEWMDTTNIVVIEQAEAQVERFRKRLITNAARNIGEEQGAESRRDSDSLNIAPQVPES